MFGENRLASMLEENIKTRNAKNIEILDKAEAAL